MVYRIHEDEIRAACDIPDRYEVVALLPLGHPRGAVGRRGAPAGGVADELGPLRRSAQVALTGGASRLRRGSHILRARGDRFAAPTAVYSVTERRYGEAMMTTVTARHADSYRQRVGLGVLAVVTAIVVAILLVVAATAGSGSGTTTHPRIGRAANQSTVCVSIGRAKIC
jgi:hypothetical protein